jgi:hypothetical protein
MRSISERKNTSSLHDVSHLLGTGAFEFEVVPAAHIFFIEFFNCQDIYLSYITITSDALRSFSRASRINHLVMVPLKLWQFHHLVMVPSKFLQLGSGINTLPKGRYRISVCSRCRAEFPSVTVCARDAVKNFEADVERMVSGATRTYRDRCQAKNWFGFRHPGSDSARCMCN